MKRLVLAACVCAATSCLRGDAAEKQQPHVAHDAAIPIAPAPRSTVEPGELRAVTAAPVIDRTGPGGEGFEVAVRTMPAQLGHSRRFGRRTLEIALRSGTRELTQFPCSSCHIGRGLRPAEERVGDAHQDVQPVHPAETGARCTTCHAAANVELLSLESGAPATLDQAYRLCAQCHSPQLESWSKGAHGKRLDGWQGRRVVMNCTDCHDPHAPGLQQRMPFRPPRLRRSER